MTSAAMATPPTQAPPRTAPGSAEPGAAPPGRTSRPLDGVRQPVRTTRPAAGHPAPLCRYDLLAPAGLPPPRGVRVLGPLAQPRTGYLSQGVQDQQAFEWYFGATAHNLAIFSNPLFTDLQNYPTGVNLMANAAVLGLGVPLAPVTCSPVRS